jgi:recombinational DNA repair protein RecT
MEIQKIKKELSNYPEIKVENYLNYLTKLANEKDNRTKELKNPWMQKRLDKNFIDSFKKVADLGLFIDGDLVSMQATGISLSYNAYKNLVLKRYPETKFDLQLVYDGDTFEFSKQDGKVNYSHKLNNPFENNKKIIGGYCIIKNRLGDFIEILGLQELEKIRKTAKTDYIWQQWTNEMYLKTIIKRACKRHFKDEVIDFEKIDNEDNYDVENPLDIDIKIKQEIDSLKTLEDLKKYYLENKESCEYKKSFDNLVTKKQKELSDENI